MLNKRKLIIKVWYIYYCKFRCWDKMYLGFESGIFEDEIAPSGDILSLNEISNWNKLWL